MNVYDIYMYFDEANKCSLFLWIHIVSILSFLKNRVGICLNFAHDIPSIYSLEEHLIDQNGFQLHLNSVIPTYTFDHYYLRIDSILIL